MVRDSNGAATGSLRGWGERTTDLPPERSKEDEDETLGRRARSRSREGRWSRGREIPKDGKGYSRGSSMGGGGKGGAWRGRPGGGKGKGKDAWWYDDWDFGWRRASSKGARGGKASRSGKGGGGGGGRRGGGGGGGGGGGKSRGGKGEKELPSEKDLDQALNAYFGKEGDNGASAASKADTEEEKKLKEARAKRFGLQASSGEVKPNGATEAKATGEAKPTNAEAAGKDAEDVKRLEREKRFGKVSVS